MRDRPLDSYEPNPVLAWVYRRFFENIEVDEAWMRAVRDADSRGTVVYVLRNLSFVDFLALDYLTKRHDLPRIRFANDLGLWILEPMRAGRLDSLRPRGPEGAVRGKIEGDHLLGALLDLQRRRPQRILLVPQVFVWSRSSRTRGANVIDAVFGPSEWPGNMRSVGQFLANWRSATLRAGEPVDLSEFLAKESDGAADEVFVRRLTYTLLRRLERERRAIVGPVKK